MYKIKFNIIAIIIIFLAQATTFAQVDSTANAQALADSIAVEKSTSDTTTEVVGKLSLVTFDDKQVQLCLVPVNGARLPNATQLQAELNGIFAPAVASVKVTTHGGVTIGYANGQNFVHGGSGWLSVYNTDQKTAIDALTDAQDDVYYLFFVDNATKLDENDKPTIVAGYMPICRRYGFIYDNPTSKYVAHELAHGAFALHHTFSDESESYHAPQGTTPNLMDYSGGTDLNHLQWQWMHESHTNLLGFLDDEGESEMIATADKDSVSLSITKLNDDFAPGVGELEIEYTLDERTQRIIAKYPNENFEVILVVADSLGNIVHTTKQKADNNASLTWNGFKDKEQMQPILFKDGPYKVSVSLVGGKKDGWLDVLGSWSDFKDKLYQETHNDSLMCISTSVDTLFNIINDPVKLDYIAYKDEFKRKDNSEKWYIDFVANCKANGYFTDSLATSPMEWLMKKGVKNTTVSFCGQAVSEILPELAEMISLADKYLQDNHPDLYNRYCSEGKYKPGPNTGVSMRYASGTKPSLHSFGASVDFSPQFNPFIYKNEKYTTIVEYIKYVTGFDVYAGKTAIKSYNASQLLLEKLHGKDWTYNDKLHSNVINDYNTLAKYKDYPIDSLSNITNSDVVIKDFAKRKESIIGYLTKTKRRIVFDDNSLEGIDILVAHLKNASGDTICTLKDNSVEKYFAKYKEFMGNFSNLEMLAKSLNKEFDVKSNRILRDGFCNIEPEVYEAFKYAHEIVSQRILGKKLPLDAGITYSSSIDAMHFGLCKELVQYLTNNP